MHCPCPKCGNLITVPNSFAGRTISCSQCGGSLLVPHPGQVSEEPSVPQSAPPPVPASSTVPPPPQTPGRKLAVASLVLSVISFLGLGPITSLPGVICGHTHLRKIKRTAGPGRGLARSGLVLGYGNLLLILVAILLPAFARAREAARQSFCTNNLSALKNANERWTKKNDTIFFPALSPQPGKLMMAWEDTGYYPDCLDELPVFLCPGDMDTPGDTGDPAVMIDDLSYYYLGYAITSEAAMTAFAQAYTGQLTRPAPFSEDIPVAPGAGTLDSVVLLRLRRNLHKQVNDALGKRLTLKEVEEAVPVYIERPDNHLPPGGHVLYLDGHIEFIRYPGKWPMTETTLGCLAVLGQRDQ